MRAGPTCTRILADFGADVIKIESPPGLDPNEAVSGPRHGYEIKTCTAISGRSRSTSKPTRAWRSCAGSSPTADVVVENFRPDVKDRLGLDYGSLRALNPRIILRLPSPGSGRRGPTAPAPASTRSPRGWAVSWP